MKLNYEEDSILLEEMVSTRNLAERTELLYGQIINKYTRFNEQSLTSLLQEAETEEDNKVAWRKRKLRVRLLNFRQWLYSNYMVSTAKMNFSNILTIYRHYEIELHKLPPISEKQCDKSIIEFKDLPTKEIIRRALSVAKPIHRAIILFQASSGCSAIETLDLRISDLLDSVSEHYTGDDVYEMINQLYRRNDIIPMFTLTRNKTGKRYHTFCTTEAFNSICAYLLTRKSLNNRSRVFKITQLHMMQLFREVNDTLGLGTVGRSNYVKFRSHMLRKFQASALYNDGLSIDVVNEMQGKSKGKTNSSYFMEDPINLKRLYVEHMDCLLFNSVDGGGVDELGVLKGRVEYLESVLNGLL